MAENIIFYGPPGTGKTFFLQKLMQRYTHYNISDKEIEDIYTKCSYSWLLISLIILQANRKMLASEISNKISELSIKLKESVSSILDAHSANYSDIETLKEAPQVFESIDNYWIVNINRLVEADNEFISKYLNGKSDEKRYSFVTFHQSFSYEDFIEGIRPEYNEISKSVDYSPKKGIFLQLCERAKNDPDKEFAIFIDEINRGNISEIFGELISLIEIDKRSGMPFQLEVQLPYSKKVFSVPKNLNIYATMNTADKSIASIDLALRRRFKFVPFPSSSEIILNELSMKGINPHNIDGIDVIKLFNTINERIEFLLDNNHLIGHAYFLKVNSSDDIISIVKYNIIPLLEEYFFEDLSNIQLILNDIDEEGNLRSNAIYMHSELDPSQIIKSAGNYQNENIKKYFINNNISPKSITKIYED